jgi:site-specific DNA-methyltransferase (adenine-specific)
LTLLLRHGDARNVCVAFPQLFTLAYLDPPFFTQRTHEMPDGEPAFEDRFEGLGHFVDYVTSLVVGAWRLVVPGGSLVVHVDPKTSHYIKVGLDGLCGRENFASEIIWRYRRWPTRTLNFQRVHDVLLRYVKPNGDTSWNQLFEPLSPKTVETWGRLRQRAVWLPGEGKAEKLRRRTSSSVTEEESPGAPLGDVWEFGIIGPSSAERTGYPTQKPEALLERLVLALTKPGDWVLDPTCGSGTTLAVCATNGRNAVGVDASEVAIRVAEKRLAGFLNLAPADLRPAGLGAP